MKHRVVWIICIMAALAAVSAGSLAVHYRGLVAEAREDNETLSEQLRSAEEALAEARKVPKPDTNALEAEVLSLRSQLAKLKEAVAEAEAGDPPEEVERAASAPPSPGNRGNWMERLKESDPERYRQIQERMDGMRERMTEAVARQAAFNLAIDPANMSEEQRANHEALLAKLESMMEMSEKFKNREEGLDMRQIGMQMGETFRDLNVLYENQRGMLLEDLGRQVGYEGEQAKAFGAYVQEIYDMTSPRSLFRGMMPMGGGRSRGNR